MEVTGIGLGARELLRVNFNANWLEGGVACAMEAMQLARINN